MIKKYWPEFLQDNDKFNELDKAESPELEEVWQSFNDVDGNQFLETANEEGIARYEKMVGIISKASESLEMRRARLLNKFSTYTPYNRAWLKNRLDSVLGKGTHEHHIEDDMLTLKTSTDEIDSIKSLRKELRKDIPCTMDMSIGLVRTSHQPMYMGSVARVGKITTITPSNQVTINVQNNNEMYVGTYVRTVKKVTIGGN